MITAKLLHEQCKLFEDGGTTELASAVAVLKEAGAIAGIYVGKANMTPQEILDWYAGQLVDMFENNALLGINSWINCIDKFAPLEEEQWT